MTTHSDLNAILEHLTQPPYDMPLTLVSFSEQTPDELLALFGKIVDRVYPKSSKQTTRVDEDLDMVAGRILDFLRWVKYKPGVDALAFREGVFNADPDVCYPAMRWILQQNEASLEKKAFVGCYLTEVEVPDEFAYDEEVQEVQAAVKELQREFVAVHSEVMQFRRSDQDPIKVKKHMQELEDEREQLYRKIERMKAKVDSAPDASNLMESAQKLRRQQEEEMNIATSLKQQRQLLDEATERYDRVTAKLRQLTAAGASGHPSVLLQSLKQDVDTNRKAVNEAAQAIEKQTQRLAAVQDVASARTPTDEELRHLEAKRDDVNQQITQQLSSRANAGIGAGSQDLALRQQQQMAQMAARKREEMEAKLERLQEKRLALTEEQESLMVAAMPGGGAGMGQDDWKEKYESVRSKMGTYKRLRAELDVVQAEALVLSRTEEVLQANAAKAGADLKKAEIELGVEGASNVASNLERVTEAKSHVDEAKGKTLEEISAVVASIQGSIKDKKAALAPRIKELRATRQEVAELTERHAQMRKRYEAEVNAFRQQNAALVKEVEKMRASSVEAEAAYHQVSCEGAIVDANIRRVTNHSEASRARDAVLNRITESEERLKTSKNRQRELKDQSTPNLGQMEIIKDLKELLIVKLEAGKQGNVGHMQARGAGAPLGSQIGGSDVLSL